VNLDIARILRILPHRPPMLFVDRVIDIDPGKSARAIKCVSVNEPLFQGYFPGEPVFPSVLCIEAMSQLMCILLYASRVMDPANQRFAFAGIEKAKFRQPIGPGDRIELAVSVVHHRSNIWKCAGTACVDDVLCVEAELVAAIQDTEDA
jgi:3-hydroxyacyl-[acyl-carrier-protein] dehydratase